METTASAQTTDLFLLGDLDDVSTTRTLAQPDLDALHAVADWIKTFVARPNKDLGRSGARRYVAPWIGRRLAGRSSGDGHLPK
jgi:hypothetical protein